MEDFKKIIANCKTYNDHETIYVKCSNALKNKMQKVAEEGCEEKLGCGLDAFVEIKLDLQRSCS